MFLGLFPPGNLMIFVLNPDHNVKECRGGGNLAKHTVILQIGKLNSERLSMQNHIGN